MDLKKNKTRKFISIYFKNGLTDTRKKRDVTISFYENDPLYEKCKELGSSKIKEVLQINSYIDLVKKAKKSDRSLGNFIKYNLKKKLDK